MAALPLRRLYLMMIIRIDAKLYETVEKRKAAGLIRLNMEGEMLSITVNGKGYSVDVPPSTPLLRVFRAHLGLTGTRPSSH